MSKIQTYTGAVLDHTIEDEALSVYSKEMVTDGVGHFNFVVPTEKGGNYVYDDIALHDKVKIYYGYDTVGATPDFIGYVSKITGPLSTASGYTRQISGLSQGEILFRRFKKNKFYTGTNASVIVAEWATDLGLGVGDITADTNQPDIEVRTKSYFDLLRYISDYWLSGANQIKKDFYVDVDNDLVWKVRPFRTTGVESFTVGKDIIHYKVTQLKDHVKNDITVYGEATKPRPSDKDSYTEPASSPPPGWTASVGTVDRDNSAPLHVGSWFVRGDDDAAQTCTFKYDLPRLTIRDINHLYVWSRSTTAVPTTAKIRLHAPDNANYWEDDFTPIGPWTQDDYGLGPEYVYDATHNPNGNWIVTGSPNWWDVEYIEFHVVWLIGVNTIDIDGLWFYPDRWTYNSTNAGSITSYGQRDLEITDDKLHSDVDCQMRAETLLYQRKDAPTQLEITVPGNTNVLVGDRLSMTIPAENISAVNFDVLSVEHLLNESGFMTKATMINDPNIRQALGPMPLSTLIHLARVTRGLTQDEKRIR